MRRRIAEREALVAELTTACEVLVDALRWTSGSYDFSPHGQAYEGWESVARPAIQVGLAAIAKAKGE